MSSYQNMANVTVPFVIIQKIKNFKMAFFAMCMVGNCDIEYFTFHHHFCIMRMKYLKFERDQNENATEKFRIHIVEREK